MYLFDLPPRPPPPPISPLNLEFPKSNLSRCPLQSAKKTHAMIYQSRLSLRACAITRSKFPVRDPYRVCRSDTEKFPEKKAVQRDSNLPSSAVTVISLQAYHSTIFLPDESFVVLFTCPATVDMPFAKSIAKLCQRVFLVRLWRHAVL